MRLTRLRARDFLSYANLDLELDDVGQVVVVGKNGHGKSALLDAVLWCIYGEGRAGADEMVRHGAHSSWVETTWDRSGAVVRIARSRSKETKAGESSLHLTVDGENRTQHTISETQRVIEDIFGLTPRALLAGPFMTQGRSDELMRSRPGERKDLLVSLLGLDRYEQLHARAKNRLLQAEGALAAAQTQLSEWASGLELLPLEDRREAVSERLAQHRAAVEAVEDFTERVSAIRDEATRVRAAISRAHEVEQRAEQLAASIEEQRAALEATTAHLASLREAARAVPPGAPEGLDALRAALAAAMETEEAAARRQGEGYAAKLEYERAKAREQEFITMQVRSLQACNVCPFVERPDPDEEARIASVLSRPEPDLEALALGAANARASLDAARLALRDAEERQRARDAAVAARDLAAGYLAASEEQEARQKATLHATEDMYAEASRELMSLSQERLREAPLVEALTQAAADLVSAKDNEASCQLLLEAARVSLSEGERAAEGVAREEARIRDLAEQQARLKVLALAWHRDGVPTLILENAVPAIEDRANMVLARMPGGFSVRFVTQRSKKSGAGVIDTLDVTVEVEGEDRDYTLLSGGERFRVDLAVRVALSEVLAHRSGSRVETLWLDEPLAALDDEGRDAVVQSLSAIADVFGLIVVVSHHDEFNDRFPVRIAVHKSDGISEAEVAA